MIEQKDIYNRQREQAGRCVPREQALEAGEYSLAVRIWLRSGGLFLIQRRQLCKRHWAGLWDCAVSGGVSAGETSGQAAVRELYEELGLTAAKNELQLVCTTLSPNRFDDIFLLERLIDPLMLRLQIEEVAETRLASHAEIKALIAAKKFIPYEYFDILCKLFASPLLLRQNKNGFGVFNFGTEAGKVDVYERGGGAAEIVYNVPPPLEDAVLLRLEQLLPQYTHLKITANGKTFEKTHGFRRILQKRPL